MEVQCICKASDLSRGRPTQLILYLMICAAGRWKLPLILCSYQVDKEIVAHIVKLKSGKQAMDEGSVSVYRTEEYVKYEEIKPFTIAKISDQTKKIWYEIRPCDSKRHYVIVDVVTLC